MTGDAVFPLPEPDFLWVHDLTILPVGSVAGVVVAADGSWQAASTVAGVAVTGYLTAPNPSEVNRAASDGITLSAVALVPRGTAVTDQDHLRATGVDQYLDGTYRIRQVRPNLSHVRLLLEHVFGPVPGYPDHHVEAAAAAAAAGVGAGD